MSLFFRLVFFLHIPLALLLSGCSGDVATEHAIAADKQEPLFILSVDGVGPLNADIPFNLISIGDAFQDFNVAQETHFREGEQYPVITVKKKIKPMLSINPDHQRQRIFSVVVHDNLIGNRLGHGIGDSYKMIYTYGQTEECAPGIEEWSGKVMCYAPKTRNILYLFVGDWDGPDGEVPAPDVMADWALEAIVWKPPK